MGLIAARPGSRTTFLLLVFVLGLVQTGFAKTDCPYGDLSRWETQAARATDQKFDPFRHVKPGEDPKAFSVTELLWRVARAEPNRVVFADVTLPGKPGWKGRGDMTAAELMTGVLFLKNRVRKVTDDPYLGTMLPTGVGSAVINNAVRAAGKTPVAFNFTAGKDSFMAAIRESGVEKILTSRAFFEKLIGRSQYKWMTSTETPELAKYFVFVEDLAHSRLGETWLKLQKAYWMIRVRSAFLIPNWITVANPVRNLRSESVVLFSSGSTDTPKTIPITHENAISMIGNVTSGLEPRQNSSFFLFLPSFHSFGMALEDVAVATGLPMATNPDSLQIKGLISSIEQAKTNYLFATPTFASKIVEKASRDYAKARASDVSATHPLASLKTIIVGAEKLEADAARAIQQQLPGVRITTGYGLTESYPALTLRRMDALQDPEMIGRIGVPFKDVELLLVPLSELSDANEMPRELQAAKMLGQESDEVGVIVASSGTIFSGYRNKSEDQQPFVTIDGKRFLNTADVARWVDDGMGGRELEIIGRLGLFWKNAGEMISCGVITKAARAAFFREEISGADNYQFFTVPQKDQGNEGGALIIGQKALQQNPTLSEVAGDPRALLAAVNDAIFQQTRDGKFKVSQVVIWEEDNGYLPVLGTGKINIRRLRDHPSIPWTSAGE